MTINKIKLKQEILNSLKEQGFCINPHLTLESNNKYLLKKIHEKKREEQLKEHKKTLMKNEKHIKKYLVNGIDIDPNNIKLKLIDVKNKKTFESKLFFWWNLVWWSLPYDRPVGRQLRFILWDEYHDAPFGLIGLQSPPMISSIRDEYFSFDKENKDYWINQSMYGQRIGALPPYNELLGGKMAALSLVSNEVREVYRKKYGNKKTLSKKRELPNRLLFTTTTGAYGKSSMYDRIKYKNEIISKFLGFTKGAGTFHISQELYYKILNFLDNEGVDIKRGCKTGPSRKLRLIDRGFNRIGLNTSEISYIFHNIKRGYYLFSNLKNLNGVIHKDERPIWHDRHFSELFDYWLERWCIPRSERKETWKSFDSDKFIDDTIIKLEKL